MEAERCSGPSPSAASAGPRSRSISPSSCSSPGSPSAPGQGGPARGARQHAVHRPHLRLRGAARVRPHPRRPPLRHPVARGDAAADRRRGQHAAPADRSRARSWSSRSPAPRSISSSAYCSFSALGSLRPGELDADRRSEPLARWAGSRPPTSSLPSSISSPPFRWTAGGCCTRCSRCGSAARCDRDRRQDRSGLCAGLGFLGLFGNPLLIFIAIFVYIAAAGEAQMSAAQQALKGLTVGEAMETRFTPISIDANLSRSGRCAARRPRSTSFRSSTPSRKPVGLLTREDILAAVRKHGGDEPASAFMRSASTASARRKPSRACSSACRTRNPRRSMSPTPTARSSAC